LDLALRPGKRLLGISIHPDRGVAGIQGEHSGKNDQQFHAGDVTEDFDLGKFHFQRR
jgi:hypothetical protein